MNSPWKPADKGVVPTSLSCDGRHMTLFRRTAIITAILASVAVPTAVLTSTAFAGNDSPVKEPKERNRQLAIEATIASFGFVDDNDPGVTAGDSFVQTDTHASGGRDVLRCTATGVETDPGVCDGALVLGDGTLTVAGPLPRFEPQDGLPFTMAVTGGTGAYGGAAGYVDVVETSTGYTATVHLLH